MECDSASFLIRSVSRDAAAARDALAVVGAAYFAGEAARILLSLARGFNEFVLPALLLPPGERNLRELSGKWAVVFKDAHHDHNLCRAFAMDLAGRGFNLVLLGRDGGEDRARMLAGEAGEQRDPYRYMGPEKAYVGTGKRAW